MSMKNLNIETKDYQIRGVYISYIEYLNNFQGNSVSINQAYINNMLDNIKINKFNTIFLHVSPFSDAIYNSSIMPSSYTIVVDEGLPLGMDYLKYFIDEAHKREIYVHAWINPYRISSTNDLSKLSSKNPALELIESNDAKVLDNGIYYNPASPKVLNLLLKQVNEILLNYDVDGIHFDDYFYSDDTIDLENYNKYNDDISIEEYRLNVINTTIRSIYKLIKSYNENIIFSISPDGNIDNNYEIHFADIKTWLTEDGYIDIIMPQVYYGFENTSKPFIKTINEWNNLITNNVKLVPVLAIYKIGLIDNYALDGKYEWVNNKDIITRQINYIKTLNHYDGFALFRYDYLFSKENTNDTIKSELDNIKNIKN